MNELTMGITGNNAPPAQDKTMAYNQLLSAAAREDTQDSDFFDGVTDFMQYGITSSLTSGVLSIANTGLSLANTFGAKYEYYDTEETLQSAGLTDTADYYNAHKESLDTLGFVATSLIPGGAGVKAVRAALRGGASSNIKLVAGLSNATNKGKYVQQLTDMVKTGAVAESTSVVKRKAIASGFYANAVEAAAAETAIAFTMNQSPALQRQDLDYFSAVGNYMTSMEFWLGTGLGASIGGTLDAAKIVSDNRKLSKFVRKAINKAAPVSDVGELAALEGDKAATAIGQYKSLLTDDPALHSPDLAVPIKENIATQEQVVKDSLSRLTRGDNDVTQPLFEMIQDTKRDVDDALGMTAGARSITRPWRNEELLDTTSVKAEIVPQATMEKAIFKAYKAHGFEGTDQELTDLIAREYAFTEGVAIRASGETPLAFARLNKTGDYLLDSIGETEAIGVLRHEIGHLTADHLSTLMTKTKVGKRLQQEAINLSRIVSPERWASSDAKMAAIAEGKLKGAAATSAQKFREYLTSGVEIMADSFRALDDPAMHARAMAAAPSLAKVMIKNNALRAQLGDTKKFINLATGEGDVQAVVFTVADIGEVKVRDSGKRIDFGRNGEQSIDATKGFDATKLSTDEASAYWYAWMRKDSQLKVAADDIIKWDDLPRIAKANKQFHDGEFSLDTVLKVKQSDGSIAEVAAMDMGDLVKTTKGELAKKMRGEVIANPEYGEAAPVRNWSEIARVLDVDREVAMFGGKGAELDNAVWSFSETYDPTKPLHAVARYAKNTLDTFQQQGMVSVNDRIRVAREHADSLTANYYGAMANQLPESMYTAANKRNPAAEIASTDKAASAFGSVQGEYNDATSFFQNVGAVLDTWTKRKSRELTDALAPTAERIKGSTKSLTELSALDSVLRRGHYMFMPNVVDDFAERIGHMTAKANGDQALVAEGTAQLKAVTDAMNEAGLGELLNYSGRNQIWTDAAARQFNKLVDESVTDINQWRKFAEEYIGDYSSKQTHRIADDAVVDFWRTKVDINDKQVLAMQRVKAAKGRSTAARTGRLYPGAYDTQRLPFVAYVSDATEEGLAGHKSVGLIGAVSEVELRAKMKQVADRWGSSVNITTRAEKKRYLEFQGRYSRQTDIDDLAMDSELRKTGVAFEVLPEPDEQILAKYLNDATSYETAIARNHMEVKYGEELAALRNYGREARDVATSSHGFLKAKGKSLNAWDQQEKVMLNISNNDAFSGWRDVQRGLDEKFSIAYSAVRDSITTAHRKNWTPEAAAEMEATMKRYGFRGAFDKEGVAGREMLVNAPIQSRGVLSGMMSQANGIVARLMLRMDTAHGLVNAMSLPIMLVPEFRALRGVVSKELAQVMDAGTNVRIPGTDKLMPSNAKLMMQATKDFFTDRELVNRYIDEGVIPASVRDVLEATDGLVDFGTHASAGKLSKAKASLLKAEELIGKPTDYSEQFTHFVAARAADLLMTPAVQRGVISEGTKRSAMQSFMRRVNGNYIAAQRPQLFQGWAGQAIGLFQTYQMNMMYNMFRYMGDNRRSAAALMAAQTSIFGVQSLPGFDWLNSKVLDRTQGEKDFYTAGTELFGDEATEWGLYGLASNFTKPLMGEGIALHTRGNLDPMNPTIIPTSLDELPAVRAFGSFFTSVGDFASNVAGGAPVDQAFYHAMAHNGLNRPIQGLGQMLQDGVTSRSSGNMLASVDQLDWWESATRLMGAKPLDEAIALENFYRMEKYKTQRASDIQRLGATVKEAARGGTLTSEHVTGFMQKYVSEGGRYDQFETWMLDRMIDATQPQLDTMRSALNTTEGRYMQRVMNGGSSE